MRRRYGVLGVLLVLLNLAWIFLIGLGGFHGEQGGFLTREKPIQFPSDLTFDHDLMIVTFGYAGCDLTCPVTLSVLARVLDAWKNGTSASRRPSLGVLLVGLTPLTELKDPDWDAHHYAQTFHESIQGLTLPSKPLKQLTRAFEIYASPSLRDAQSFDHAGFLYFLKRIEGDAQAGDAWQMQSMFVGYPPEVEEIVAQLQKM